MVLLIENLQGKDLAYWNRNDPEDDEEEYEREFDEPGDGPDVYWGD